MALDNMLPQPAPLLPGAPEYIAECVRLTTEAAASCRVEWDQQYEAGDNPRQRLDIWLPADPQGAPVFVLFHGGALRSGCKEWMGGHAPAILAAGGIVVTPNYRLTPNVRVVDIEADSFNALAWVHHNIEKFGGDPNRLIVGGHSSGGHIAGLLATRSDELESRHIPVEAIKAALLVSSVISCLPEDYSENSPARRLFDERFSSMKEAEDSTIFTHLDKTSVPFHVAFGEQDSPDLISQNWRLIAQLAQRKKLIGSDVIKDADHFTAHLACCDANGVWMAKVRELLG